MTHLAALGVHTIDDFDSGEVVDPEVEPSLIQHEDAAARAASSRVCSPGVMYNVVITCVLPVIAACTTGGVVCVRNEREDEVVHGDGNLERGGVRCGDVEHEG
jgi:hypothetical protein